MLESIGLLKNEEAEKIVKELQQKMFQTGRKNQHDWRAQQRIQEKQKWILKKQIYQLKKHI